MTLQAEVVSKSLYGNHPICGPSEMAVDLALHQHGHHPPTSSHLGSPQPSPTGPSMGMTHREALNLGSSLHALQNLQPWGSDGRLGGSLNNSISLHSTVERPFSLGTSALC